MMSLADYRDILLEDGDSKEQFLLEARGVAQVASRLLLKHESYYAEPLQEIAQVWKTEAADIASVHYQVCEAWQLNLGFKG